MTTGSVNYYVQSLSRTLQDSAPFPTILYAEQVRKHKQAQQERRKENLQTVKHASQRGQMKPDAVRIYKELKDELSASLLCIASEITNSSMPQLKSKLQDTPALSKHISLCLNKALEERVLELGNNVEAFDVTKEIFVLLHLLRKVHTASPTVSHKHCGTALQKIQCLAFSHFWVCVVLPSSPPLASFASIAPA